MRVFLENFFRLIASLEREKWRNRAREGVIKIKIIIIIINNCKICPCPTHEGVQRRRGIAPLILNLEGGKWLASCPGCLTPWELSQYPLNKRLGGPQNQCGQKNLLTLPRFKDLIFQSVAQSTLRLRYSGPCNNGSSTNNKILWYGIHSAIVCSSTSDNQLTMD